MAKPLARDKAAAEPAEQREAGTTPLPPAGSLKTTRTH
ncbi:hypothetical protein MKleb_5559 (plasmid) [Klebsiella sp. PL-2018]|nr:hypothetical protein MKleb_5559 [Klebsiella sp. PL-2018]